ncbi:hypothetical protein, partial [Methanosarcina mazei]
RGCLIICPRVTGRAARSIPHPLGWGGRPQFDLYVLILYFSRKKAFFLFFNIKLMYNEKMLFISFVASC